MLQRIAKYNKAAWAAFLGAVTEIIEWGFNTDIPERVVVAAVVIVVFFVPNADDNS